jgi:hypothetical protein
MYIRPNPTLPQTKQADLKVAFMVDGYERNRTATLDVNKRLMIGKSFADGIEPALRLLFRDVRTVGSRDEFVADTSCAVLIDQYYSYYGENIDMSREEFHSGVTCRLVVRGDTTSYECEGRGSKEWRPSDGTGFGIFGAAGDLKFLRKDCLNQAIRSLTESLLAKLDSVGVLQ